MMIAVTGQQFIQADGSNSVTIVKDERTQNSLGENSFHYELSNGVTRKESGTQNNGQIFQGSWRLVND